MDGFVFKEVFKEELHKRDMLLGKFCAGTCSKDEDLWDYCFSEFCEGSCARYRKIAERCVEHGISTVYDIGCCIAFQAKVFQSYGIDYVGIEVDSKDIELAPKGTGIRYIHGKYPFPVVTADRDHTAAVSELCIGYLAYGDAVQQQLADDFEYFCGAVGSADIKPFYRNFRIVKRDISEGLPVYFAERQRERLLDRDSSDDVVLDLSQVAKVGKERSL